MPVPAGQVGVARTHTNTHVIIAVRCLMHKLKNFLILLLASLDVFFSPAGRLGKAKKVFLLPPPPLWWAWPRCLCVDDGGFIALAGVLYLDFY